MRPRSGVATAALLGAMVSTAQARAQFLDWRASIGVTAAYNRTISDSATQAYSGMSLSLSPSINGIYETPRTENTLTYAFSLDGAFLEQANSKPFTYSNNLAYSGRFLLNEITNMTLGLGLTQTPIISFTPTTDATETAVQTVPTGAQYLLQVTGQQGLTRELPDAWSLNQTATVNYGYPVDLSTIRSRTLSVQSSLGISHAFLHDSLGLSAANQTNYFTASQAADQTVTAGNTEIANTLSVTWSRSWLESFSSTLSLGVTQVISPDAESKTATPPTRMLIQPSGAATLNYLFNVAAVNLMYLHQAAPNMATAQITFTDSVSLRFAMPIGGKRVGVSVEGTGGYSRQTPIGSNGAPEAPINLVVSDVQVKYKPPFVSMLSAGLRGQLQRQVPTGTTDMDLANTFTRYTIALTLTYSYPSASAGNVRPRLTPVYSVTPPTQTEIVSTGGPGPTLPVREAAPITSP